MGIAKFYIEATNGRRPPWKTTCIGRQASQEDNILVISEVFLGGKLVVAGLALQ
jgi:hypothetical protein